MSAPVSLNVCVQHHSYVADDFIVQHFHIRIDQEHAVRIDIAQNPVKCLAMCPQGCGQKIKTVVLQESAEPDGAPIAGLAIHQQGPNFCMTQTAQQCECCNGFRIDVNNDRQFRLEWKLPDMRKDHVGGDIILRFVFEFPNRKRR
jgi:hypothetical protein